jgi:hypothetical protein
LLVIGAPDKSRLAPLRILDVLAQIYPLLSAPAVTRLARSRWLRPIEACGRIHSRCFPRDALWRCSGASHFGSKDTVCWSNAW